MKRTTIDHRNVADQIHSESFDKTIEGMVATHIWTAWKNLHHVLDMPVMLPHRKSWDRYLKAYIPAFIAPNPDETVEEAIVRMCNRRCPLDANAFMAQAMQVLLSNGIPMEHAQTDYGSWALAVYGNMLSADGVAQPAFRWLAKEAVRIATAIPNTLLRDMSMVTVRELPVLYMVRRYLKYGETYLAGIGEPRRRDEEEILQICPRYRHARYIKGCLTLATAQNHISTEDELTMVMAYHKVQWRETDGGWYDDIAALAAATMVERLGADDIQVSSMIKAVNGVIRRFQKLALQQLMSADSSARAALLRMPPKKQLGLVRQAVSQLFADNPHLGVRNGRLVRDLTVSE